MTEPIEECKDCEGVGEIETLDRRNLPCPSCVSRELKISLPAGIRKEFEGCITEIGANKTLAANDDYNKGWNDASDHAIRFIRRYIRKEGLFQL